MYFTWFTLHNFLNEGYFGSQCLWGVTRQGPLSKRIVFFFLGRHKTLDGRERPVYGKHKFWGDHLFWSPSAPVSFSLSSFVFSPLATHKYIFWNFVIFKCKTKSKIDEFCWLPDYTYYFDKFLCWTLSIWKWCQCQCRCLDKGVWSWNFKFPLLQPRTRTGLSSHFMRHLGPPAVADQFYLLVH